MPAQYRGDFALQDKGMFLYEQHGLYLVTLALSGYFYGHHRFFSFKYSMSQSFNFALMCTGQQFSASPGDGCFNQGMEVFGVEVPANTMHNGRVSLVEELDGAEAGGISSLGHGDLSRSGDDLWSNLEKNRKWRATNVHQQRGYLNFVFKIQNFGLSLVMD